MFHEGISNYANLCLMDRQIFLRVWNSFKSYKSTYKIFFKNYSNSDDKMIEPVDESCLGRPFQSKNKRETSTNLGESSTGYRFCGRRRTCPKMFSLSSSFTNDANFPSSGKR